MGSILDEAFANINYKQLTNAYREKYNIVHQEEIIAIRKQYELSGRKMSEFMGFGPNTYRLYEEGEVPSNSNSKLIQLAADPHEFWKIVKDSTSIDKATMGKLEKRIENLLNQRRNSKQNKNIEEYLLGGSKINSYTGFKSPDFEKFTGMIHFFTQEIKPLNTKLNKLLFYSDFLMYKNFGNSISGFKYSAIPMGPVPDKFNSIYDYLVEIKIIDLSYKEFSPEIIGVELIPLNNISSEIFTDEEFKTLQTVARKFKDFSTEEIIEFSHQEIGWKDNQQQRSLIDYRYAFELNI